MHCIALYTQAKWSPERCSDLLRTFLNYVTFLCRNEDSPDTVYKYDFDSKNTSSRTIQCTVYKGKNEYSFLPEWYIDEVQEFI